MPKVRSKRKPPKRYEHEPVRDKPTDDVAYPIPASSSKAWLNHKNKSPQNPSLIFDRFAPDWGTNENKDAKKRAYQEVAQAARKVDFDILTALNKRWAVTVKAAQAEIFNLKTDWRFVSGLGRKGPLEVGFTFHRYGFPILPGSSVKGVARAYGLMKIAYVLDENGLKGLDNLLDTDKDLGSAYPEASQDAKILANKFRLIFGTTDRAGYGIFFDAIPQKNPVLELDIMNPHYPKYYNDKDHPTDSQNPAPIYFLAVAPNTEFRFALGWRGPLDYSSRQLKDLAKGWLIDGLRDLGAGAKTSSGYGYFVMP